PSSTFEPVMRRLVFLAFFCGCAAQIPLPMTAAELAQYDSGPALVAYLGQPDASPTVCDLRAPGPHVARFDEDMRNALVAGLVDGKIDTFLWKHCVDSLLRTLPPEAAASLIDACARGYRKLLTDSHFEKNAELAIRTDRMEEVYADRPNG